MNHQPLKLDMDKSYMLKLGEKLRKESKIYERRNHTVHLPKLNMREVYMYRNGESKEIIVEAVYCPPRRIKESIEQYCIKEILKNMGIKNIKVKRILEEAKKL